MAARQARSGLQIKVRIGGPVTAGPATSAAPITWPAWAQAASIVGGRQESNRKYSSLPGSDPVSDI